MNNTSSKYSIRLTLGAHQGLENPGDILLAALSAAGVSHVSVGEADAIVHLWLAESGWQEGNLAALIAAARAGPNIEFRLESLSGNTLATALADSTANQGRAERQVLRPGWGRPEVVFLDRDGTLMEDRHYLGDRAGVTLLPGTITGLRLLAEHDLPTAVLTNQSGVGRGLISASQVAAVHDRLTELLSLEGLRLAGIFCCPHAPEDDCRCRKPRTGLAEQAAAALGVDLDRAIMVGDRQPDLDLARHLGIPGFLVTTGAGRATQAAGSAGADYLVDDLAELARLVTHPAGLPFSPRHP